MPTEAVAEINDGSDAQSEEQVRDPLETIEDPKLKETVKTVLRNLVSLFSGMEKFSRRQEVMETRRQRFYWRNDQYIWWNASLFVYVPLQGGGGVGGGQSGAVDMPRYTDVYNIYTPYGESLIAPLAQNPPGVNFEPDDPMQPVDVAKSKAAEKYKQQIDRDNEMKKLRTEVARLMYTDTRVVLYSRPVSDEQELGSDDNGQPNTKQLITAHGTLESKVVPLTAKTRADLVAAYVYDDPQIDMAKQQYPDAADQIQEATGVTGESSYERFARLGVLQGTKLLSQAGDALKHIVPRQRVWLRPAAFKKAPKENQELLKQLYPTGCKVIMCGDALCSTANETMDDHLSIGFASPGDGMSRASLGKRMVPLQDAFNDGMNLWTEANGYCIPVTFYDEKLIDVEALREQVAEPGNHIPVDVPAGATLEECFHEQVSTGIPVSLTQALQMIQGPLAQFMSGALPALLGQGEANNKTKGGIEILRDAAMGRIGIPWGHFQELFASAYLQSIEGAANVADDKASFAFERKNRRGALISTENVKFSDLKKGNIRCFPDLDSSFPETTNAKRNTYMQLVTEAANNPGLAEDLQLPDNQELGHELVGLTDFVVSGAEARQKQLEEIQQLLKDGPTPPPPAAFDAIAKQNPQAVPLVARFVQAWEAAKSAKPPQLMPVPPKALWPLFAPSVDVDGENDFNEDESAECKRWLSSQERREQDKAGNSLGVMNVILHKQRHDKAIAANQPAPQQKPVSASMNFKDLPPEGQVQLAAQEGIKINPPNPILDAVTGGNKKVQ